MKRLGVVLAVMALISACQAPDQHVPLSASTVQPAQMDRLNVDLYTPGTPAAKGWRVSVSVDYRPVNFGEPGTVITTESRSNCLRSTHVVFVPLPNFRKCKGSVVRTESVVLPANQVSLAGEHSLDIDFAPMITARDSDYEIDHVNLRLVPCEGCEEIVETFQASCWAQGHELEILANQYLLNYRKGRAIDPKASACGLEKGGESYWASRKDALARIRGHFNADTTSYGSDLLDRLGLIPTPGNGWVHNPTAKLNAIDSRLCLRPPNKVESTRLEKSAAWPYEPDVEVRLTLDEHGRPCIYTLSGTAKDEFTSDVRLRYTFIDDHLVQVDSAEPNDLRRTWRWVDDQPMEFIQRAKASNRAEPDKIVYWQKTAAQYWPRQMDYKPDLASFTRQKAFAEQLRQRFVPGPQEP